jgi:hypothetical protein
MIQSLVRAGAFPKARSITGIGICGKIKSAESACQTTREVLYNTMARAV